MTIRPVEPRDVERVVELGTTSALASGLRAFPADPTRIETLLTRVIVEPTMQGFVAERDGRVVGQIAAHVYPHPMLEASMASIFSCWVEPAHRGHAGLALFRAITAWAKAQGAQVIEISALPESNVGPLCAALGFEPSEASWVRRL